MKNTIFPNVLVSAEAIENVMNHVPTFAGNHATLPKGLGFSLIRGTLVPNTFVEAVEYELLFSRLGCFEVQNVDDLFRPPFLQSLNTLEKDVLGEVVMLLIEQDRLPISLIDPKEAA